MKIVPFCTALVFCGFNVALADVTLPPLISDNMLLQQGNAAIWGKADPDEQVTVSLGETVSKTKADAGGKWRVKLEALKPGFTSSMTIAGKNTLVIQNVCAGDVWLCAGQSNMEMMVGPLITGPWRGYRGVANFEKEIVAAQFPKIRLFRVAKRICATPIDEVEGKWEVCTPETVKDWSAVGYFFARQLHTDLGLPIGMIQSAWGGSCAQNWTPSTVLENDSTFKSVYIDPWLAYMAKYPMLKEKYENELLPAWKAAAEAAKTAGTPIPPKPQTPSNPAEDPSRAPSVLYNGMISSMAKYPIKGVIWYQGEGNIGDAHYSRLLPAMIDSWRKAWECPAIPFYIVQLPNFQARQPEPEESNWAAMREVQRQIAKEVQHSELAATIDLGEEKNIHPIRKQEVGYRLALIAEAKTYKKDIVCSGPDLKDASFNGGDVQITFKPDTVHGLTTNDGQPIKGFAIAGEDKKFVWAAAKVVPNKDGLAIVVVNSPQVPKPVSVRYAWANNPEVNLVNQEGLPAVPFWVKAKP